MCDEISCQIDDSLLGRQGITVSETDRRQFLAGAISLPLASILASPQLAAFEASKTEDIVIKVDDFSLRGALARPEKSNGAGILLIHEWWGLNDQIKSVAMDYAKLGYTAFAVDLYGGKVGTTRDEAMTLIRAVDADQATREVSAAVAFLKREYGAKAVGTVGWCFGGGWSLNTSIATPVDATVIYYGRVTRDAADLKALKGPVMGHFGTQDRGINKDMVDGFEAEMAKAGKSEQLTVHWYDANHAFANPTSARYDAPDAKLAWDRTIEFFKSHLL